MDFRMQTSRNQTLTAAVFICGYAAIIGFIDNFVRVIAAEGGLWQFHAVRSVMALTLMGLCAVPFGLHLRPRRFRAVAARSLIHGTAMLIYFACLSFLPVGQVVAGLFTAPLFVLLYQRLLFAETIGLFRIVAAALGFAGVLLVLGPAVLAGQSPAALLPVAAGALYAAGNIATRRLCEGESAETLVAGFFAIMGIMGVAGLGLLALWPLVVPDGAAGFVQRGWVWPSVTFYIWTFAQAAGSIIGVMLMIRAYQIADAGRVSVFEYLILPAASLWGWVLWNEQPNAQSLIGMAMIAAAGAMIALRASTASEGPA